MCKGRWGKAQEAKKKRKNSKNTKYQERGGGSEDGRCTEPTFKEKVRKE
jgi:hypothetical protein